MLLLDFPISPLSLAAFGSFVAFNGLFSFGYVIVLFQKICGTSISKQNDGKKESITTTTNSNLSILSQFAKDFCSDPLIISTTIVS
jgi:hypothetical protein